MTRIPYERYAGQVPTPFAVYRPLIFGMLGMLPSMYGIASFAEPAIASRGSGTPYLARLAELRDAEIDAARGVVQQAESEKRDLTDDELATVRARRADAERREAQITEIEALEARAAKAAEQRARFRGTTDVQVTHAEAVYRKGGEASFFRDMINALRGDMDAADRLRRNNAFGEERERRDGTSTSATSFGSFIPPVWLVAELAAMTRVGRVLAPFLRDGGFPLTTSITIPRITTGSSEAGQAGDNAAVSKTDIVTAQLARTTVTIAGQQDLAIQALDLSPYNVDQIIFADLNAAYEQELDRQIHRGSGTNELLGVNQVATINAVTYTDATPTVPELYPKIADAIQRIHANRYAPAQLISMHPKRWGWILASLDTQNRPLVVPGAGVNTVARYGPIAAESVVGEIMGVPVVTTGSHATNLGAGTNQDQIDVFRPSDVILMEGPRRSRVLSEVLSNTLEVRLQVWAYVNLFAGRFPKSISTIDGTGLIDPTF